jgi:hypothetical protein
MITYFFRFFEPLVHDGHLYVLETPLFRVRNKEQTLYCYSEAERDEAAKKIGRGAEITRFKGLGEISPKEFKQFIGPDMRLSQVEFAPKPDSTHILGFYMGRNTPDRRDYIMENLVVPPIVSPAVDGFQSGSRPGRFRRPLPRADSGKNGGDLNANVSELNSWYWRASEECLRSQPIVDLGTPAHP